MVASTVTVSESAQLTENAAGDHAGALYAEQSKIWVLGNASLDHNYAADDGVSLQGQGPGGQLRHVLRHAGLGVREDAIGGWHLEEAPINTSDRCRSWSWRLADYGTSPP